MDAKKLYDKFIAAGFSPYGAAALIGQLEYESGLDPLNLQNTANKRLGMTDAEYTAAVDSGSYKNFVHDKAGYGLAQWTDSERKQMLLLYARTSGKSIGDGDMQVSFILKELRENYKAVYQTLVNAKSVREASDIVLTKYEQPGDQSEQAKKDRAAYGQKYYDLYAARKEIPMTEMELRNLVVSIARKYIGCRQGDSIHKKIVDLYNSGRPAGGYKLTYQDPWCAGTGSAVAIEANCTDIIPVDCSCKAMIAKFKQMGGWQESDAYVPKPADYIFYDWQDSGVGDNMGDPDHVGIVEKCDGKTITVIEGNKNKAMDYRQLAVNGRYIRGFGVPDYAGKARRMGGSAVTTPKPIVSVSPATKIEDALGFDASLAGKYKTVTDLNLRPGPGKEPVLVVIPEGESVWNYGYYTMLSNKRWLSVQCSINGKKYTGFCSYEFLTK